MQALAGPCHQFCPLWPTIFLTVTFLILTVFLTLSALDDHDSLARQTHHVPGPFHPFLLLALPRPSHPLSYAPKQR